MNALVVGLGRMGRLHAKVLADLGYQVTTVDPDPETAAQFVSLDEARASHHFVPGSPRPFDVAAIATPISVLAETAFTLAGTRMLVEKPFAPDARTASMLAAYLESFKTPVCVGYVERFNPQVRAAERAIARLRARPGGPMRPPAHFIRWNERPSPDGRLDLDLLSHDVDLALHLGVSATYDTRDCERERVRAIQLYDEADDFGVTLDLTAHNQSPLHAMWHAFLSGRPYPTPKDAVRVLCELERLSRPCVTSTAPPVA